MIMCLSQKYINRRVFGCKSGEMQAYLEHMK